MDLSDCPTPSLEQIGAGVRAARLAKGWTQAQLAQWAGVSRKLVNELECGRGTDIGARKLLDIIAACGLSIHIKPWVAKDFQETMAENGLGPREVADHAPLERPAWLVDYEQEQRELEHQGREAAEDQIEVEPAP